jgi:hypothetical protein
LAILQKRHSLGTPLFRDFDKLIIAHGGCIETNANAFVKRAFQMADVSENRTTTAKTLVFAPCALLLALDPETQPQNPTRQIL